MFNWIFKIFSKKEHTRSINELLRILATDLRIYVDKQHRINDDPDFGHYPQPDYGLCGLCAHLNEKKVINYSEYKKLNNYIVNTLELYAGQRWDGLLFARFHRWAPRDYQSKLDWLDEQINN